MLQTSVKNKIKNLFSKMKGNTQKGMTYVELIVVLSVFAIISSVSLFNYKVFQDKVDIQNLSADIALRIAKAQKDALSGYFPPAIAPYVSGISGADWKPSYGIYFNVDSSVTNSDKSFYYFADLNQDKKLFSSSSCSFVPVGTSSECFEQINITKGNKIKEIKIHFRTDPATNLILNNLHITFTRPDSGATFQSINAGVNTLVPPPFIDYAELKVTNAGESVTSIIKVYPSGRIEIN